MFHQIFYFFQFGVFPKEMYPKHKAYALLFFSFSNFWEISTLLEDLGEISKISLSTGKCQKTIVKTKKTKNFRRDGRGIMRDSPPPSLNFFWFFWFFWFLQWFFNISLYLGEFHELLLTKSNSPTVSSSAMCGPLGATTSATTTMTTTTTTATTTTTIAIPTKS